MLLIEDLAVEVGGKTILNHINMEIPEGETHILFGPNGSGKTSLMMTIVGFSGYKVTNGKITFKGEDITLRLRFPYEGRRNFKGRLTGVDGDEIILVVTDHEYLFPVEGIEKANVVPRF